MAEEPAQKKARVEEGSSYYKEIDGVKYDRELLEKAEVFAKDGQVSYAEANQLWQAALDGHGVTDTEKLTLEYTMTTLKYTDKAKKFLREQLDSGKKQSYYKQIDGVKYDRELLEEAEEFAKDGRVSEAEAKSLWEDAQDGKGVTETEARTLEYTMTAFKYTDKAADFMKRSLDGDKKKSYYKQIDGVKYDRELLELAEEFAKDGQISVAEAQKLWEEALDGKGVTETEARTLEYTMTAFNYTDKAAKFMKRSLAGDKKASYYKQIDGVKYDRELLEKAEQFQKDGQISHAEAKELWEDALDGKGVTATEKRTLEYTMKHFKYTDKASDFMKKALGANVSYYKVIDGVKYDRELLELANSVAKDGQVSHEDAQKLLEAAKDGKGITDIEKETLNSSIIHALAHKVEGCRWWQRRRR